MTGARYDGRMVRLLAAASVTLAAVACGGDVVVDPSGQGGTSSSSSSSGKGGAGGGTTTTSVSSSSQNSSVTTGPSGCFSHEECPGGVCIFALGQCAAACDGFCESCGPGSVCDGCATSSCPACADCKPACVPFAPPRCDEDDPCPPGETCLWGQNTCAPLCPIDIPCAPGLFCAECATGSCCGCDDCVSVCLPGE